jgi:hypothetical protein
VLMITVDIHSALPYSKLLTFAFLLEILAISLCLLLVLDVDVVTQLDAHQQKIC